MTEKVHKRTIVDPVLFSRLWKLGATPDVDALEIETGESGSEKPSKVRVSVRRNVSYADFRSGRDLLSEKRFTIKDTDISYRELNHWASQGLVDDEREEESRGWRKLSIRDILWLRTLKELRDYGTPLERIKEVYQQQVHKPETFVTTAFDDALWACYGNAPISAFLILPKSGKSIILSGKTLRIMERQGLPSLSYLKINLNELFCEIAGDSAVMPKERAIVEDKESDEELKEIIEFIKASQEAEEIKIRKNKGKVLTLEATHRAGCSEKVRELLKDIQFGSSTVQYENGKAVSTAITKKKRPK